jgi:N-formylglutamate deformylase
MTFRLHGLAEPRVPLVLDSPHSGFQFPADFDAVVSEFDLRDGEDCFVDELYMPATELGVPLLSALTPRTYLDPNRDWNDDQYDNYQYLAPPPTGGA